MNGRAATTWMLIIFLSGWFGVIMPGHQRGAVALPGSSAADGAMAGAPQCPMCTALSGGSQDEDAPPTDPARDCAICFLAGVMSTPDTTVFVAPDFYLLDYLPMPAVLGLGSFDYPLPRQGRAPPLA